MEYIAAIFLALIVVGLVSLAVDANRQAIKEVSRVPGRRPKGEGTMDRLIETTHNSIIEACGDLWAATGFSPRPLPDTRGIVKKALRAAVADERERCAKVDPLLIACPQCEADVGQYCNNYCDCHSPRWRAAIRREGEKIR